MVTCCIRGATDITTPARAGRYRSGIVLSATGYAIIPGSTATLGRRGNGQAGPAGAGERRRDSGAAARETAVVGEPRLPERRALSTKLRCAWSAPGRPADARRHREISLSRQKGFPRQLPIRLVRGAAR